MEDLILYFFAIVFGLVVVVALAFKLLGFPKRKGLDAAKFMQQWQAIDTQSRDGASGRQLAIVNADKLLDAAMRDLGYKGQTMGERLKGHRSSFSDIDGIWQAHKLRNRIAHETSVTVSDNEARRALGQLRRGLKDLGAL